MKGESGPQCKWNSEEVNWKKIEQNSHHQVEVLAQWNTASHPNHNLWYRLVSNAVATSIVCLLTFHTYSLCFFLLTCCLCHLLCTEFGDHYTVTLFAPSAFYFDHVSSLVDGCWDMQYCILSSDTSVVGTCFDHIHKYGLACHVKGDVFQQWA